MSTSDPIADMITRVRNAQNAGHEEVSVPVSKMKKEIARVLKEYGYISDVADDPENRAIILRLRYTKDGEPVIRGIRRFSRPGLRRYAGADEIPMILGGMGHSVISTSKGIMSGRQARKMRIGGEVLLSVW